MPLETSLATEQWLRPCPAFLAQKRPLVSHPSCEGMSLEAQVFKATLKQGFFESKHQCQWLRQAALLLSGVQDLIEISQANPWQCCPSMQVFEEFQVQVFKATLKQGFFESKHRCQWLRQVALLFSGVQDLIEISQANPWQCCPSMQVFEEFLRFVLSMPFWLAVEIGYSPRLLVSWQDMCVNVIRVEGFQKIVSLIT